MYSFDPCFTVKAPEALSTVPISTVLDTFTKVVDEWLSQVNVPKDPSPLKVCLLIWLPFTESTSWAGLYVNAEPPSITPAVVWNNTFKEALVFVPATVGILTTPLNVETPATLILSKFVWPSTSKSPLISADVAVQYQ